MIIKEFMGLPFAPSVEEIRSNPESVKEFLDDLVNSVSEYLREIINNMNNEIMFVKGRLGIGIDEPSHELDVIGEGNFSESIAIPANKKIMLEGPQGDTYIIFNSSNGFIEFFVNGSREGHLDPASGWVTD